MRLIFLRHYLEWKHLGIQLPFGILSSKKVNVGGGRLPGYVCRNAGFFQKKKRIQAELVNCRQEAKIHWYGTSAGVLQPLP